MTDPALIVTAQMHFVRRRYGQKYLQAGAASAIPAPGRVPRITRLMALAIRLDQLVREGRARDYAELARAGHVTRARVTQIMNLLNLAPDIQEAILSLPPVARGHDAITERDLRPIASEISWTKQRRRWSHVQRRLQQQPPDEAANISGDRQRSVIGKFK